MPFAMLLFDRYQVVFSLCLLGLAGLSGCGSENDPTASVQGTVTLNGVLAQTGNVVFHPHGGGPTAYGVIDKEGTFVLRIGRGNVRNADDSVIYPGEYVATVTMSGPSTPDLELEGAPPITGPALIAAKYSKKATSGLSYSLKQGLNVVNIKVESPSEEEVRALAAAEQARASLTETDTVVTEQGPVDEEGDGHEGAAAVSENSPAKPQPKETAEYPGEEPSP